MFCNGITRPILFASRKINKNMIIHYRNIKCSVIDAINNHTTSWLSLLRIIKSKSTFIITLPYASEGTEGVILGVGQGGEEQQGGEDEGLFEVHGYKNMLVNNILYKYIPIILFCKSKDYFVFLQVFFQKEKKTPPDGRRGI